MEAAKTKDACYAKFLLVGFSIILAILNIAWLVTQFIWYSECDVGTMVLAITAVFFVFFYIVAITLEFGCTVFR